MPLLSDFKRTDLQNLATNQAAVQAQDVDFGRYLGYISQSLNVADRIFDFAGEADERRIRELQAQAALEQSQAQKIAAMQGGVLPQNDMLPTLLLVGGGVLIVVLAFKAFGKD